VHLALTRYALSECSVVIIIIIIIIINSANEAEVMWSMFVILSFCTQYRPLTDESGNERRPNLAKGGPLEVINFWWWSRSACGFRIPFNFLHHCGIGDFWTFVNISHTINGRFVPYLAKWVTPSRWIYNILKQMRETSGTVCGLIRKSGFEFRIIFGWNFGVGPTVTSMLP